MAQIWPAQLDNLLAEQGFGIQKGDTTIRSDMETGPQKVRRRFTKSVDEYSASLYLSREQYTIFETFYNTTLGGGVLTFLFNHPITQVSTEFRFKSQPSYSPIGSVGDTLVSFKWEKLP